MKENKTMFQRTWGESHRYLLTLVAMLAVAGFSASANAGTHFAVAVGIDNYSPYYGVSSLGSCINDANGFLAGLMQDSARWQPENLALFTDDAATADTIRAGLRVMAELAQPGDVCVYFHSGHGGQESGADTYLCAYDGPFGDWELGAELAGFNSGVQVIVIVDACFSAGLFKHDGATAHAKLIDAPQWQFADNVLAAAREAHAQIAETEGEAMAKALGPNIAFITASDFDETSAAGSVYSAFAGQFIGGMGEPQADANGDGQWTFAELFTWAEPRTLQINPEQHAQILNEQMLSQVIAVGSMNGAAPAASTDDDFEENDTIDTAADLPLGRHALVGADADWFLVRGSGDLLTVTIDGPEGDLDLAVFDAYGNPLAVSEAVGSFEAVQISAGNAGTYGAQTAIWFIAVIPYEGAGSAYTLDVQFTSAASTFGNEFYRPTEYPQGTPNLLPVAAAPCGAGAPVGLAFATLMFGPMHLLRRRK